MNSIQTQFEVVHRPFCATLEERKQHKGGNVTEDQYLELARLGWGITAQLTNVNESVLSMWDVGLDEDYEDQKELIQVYKKLSKAAKKEIGELSETNFKEIFENVRNGVGE